MISIVYQQIKIALSALLFSFIFLWSCNGDDDSSTSDDRVTSEDRITLDDVAEGEGIMVVSGGVEKTLEGIATFSNTRNVSVNETDFTAATYSFSSGTEGAAFTVYWPTSAGSEIPAGEYEIGFRDGLGNSNTTSDWFIEFFFVVVDGVPYSSRTLASGSATISNVSVDYDMDMTFTANTLETSQPDSENDPIDIAGAFKSRD